MLFRSTELQERVRDNFRKLREDWWDVARSEGVEVCLNPVSVRLRKRVGLGVRDHFQEPDQDQRNFVQTIRSRVRGKYVTGLCVVASHPVPAPLPGSPGLIDGCALA